MMKVPSRKEIYAVLHASEPGVCARAIAWCDAAVVACERELAALKERELQLCCAWGEAIDKVRGGWPSPERSAADALRADITSLRETQMWPLQSTILSAWEDRAKWLRDGYPMYSSGSGYDPDGGPFGTEGAWGD